MTQLCVKFYHGFRQHSMQLPGSADYKTWRPDVSISFWKTTMTRCWSEHYWFLYLTDPNPSAYHQPSGTHVLNFHRNVSRTVCFPFAFSLFYICIQLNFVVVEKPLDCSVRVLTLYLPYTFCAQTIYLEHKYYINLFPQALICLDRKRFCFNTSPMYLMIFVVLFAVH